MPFPVRSPAEEEPNGLSKRNQDPSKRTSAGEAESIGRYLLLPGFLSIPFLSTPGSPYIFNLLKSDQLNLLKSDQLIQGQNHGLYSRDHRFRLHPLIEAVIIHPHAGTNPNPRNPHLDSRIC